MATDTKKNVPRNALGQLMPGASLNPGGRPKKINVLRLARDRMESARQLWRDQGGEGAPPDTLEDAVWKVFQAMLLKGALGDVQAAKVVVDYCAESHELLEPDVPEDGATGPVPPKVLLSFAEQLKRTAEICGEVSERTG